MKICPKCNQPVEDNATFCANCGLRFAVPQSQPAYDPYDHSGEFSPKDISENKVISMLVYLLGPIGIIIALLASNTSPYAGYHVRQALKFTVVEILSTIALVLLYGFGALFMAIDYEIFFGWTMFAGAVYGGFMLFLTVLKFICFFQICCGKSKEPILIRNLGFMR